MPDPTWDLVTNPFATSLLQAAGVSLSDSQVAILDTLVTSASREIQRWCNRRFPLTTYDEILIPIGGRADRGEAATCKTKGYPVQSIVGGGIRAGRSTAITITNADPTTNQDASVSFTATGDPEVQLTYTGLTLYSIASGTETIHAPTWTTVSPFTTIQSLAATINGYGGGWQAKVTGGTGSGLTNLGLYPAAWLCGAREAKGGFSPGTALDVFANRINDFTIDRPSGIISIGYETLAGAVGFNSSSNFGLADWGDPSLPSYWGQIRATYTAGWSTIPADIQQVCGEVIKATYERLKADGTLQSESIKEYSWAARQVIQGLPDWCLQILMLYKDARF